MTGSSIIATSVVVCVKGFHQLVSPVHCNFKPSVTQCMTIQNTYSPISHKFQSDKMHFVFHNVHIRQIFFPFLFPVMPAVLYHEQVPSMQISNLGSQLYRHQHFFSLFYVKLFWQQSLLLSSSITETIHMWLSNLSVYLFFQTCTAAKLTQWQTPVW